MQLGTPTNARPRSRPAPPAPRRHRLGAAVVFALLLSGLGLAVVSPAAALSTFGVTQFTNRPAVAGAEVDITFVIDNTGPDVAEQVTFSVEAPPGFTAVGDLNCVDPNSCSLLPFGEFFPGTARTATIRYFIDPDYVVDNGGGAGSALAQFQASIGYDLGSQSTNQEISVGEQSDLRIRKYANPSVVDAGQTFSYGIDVDNLGPSTARDVAIADALFADVGQAGSTLDMIDCGFSTASGGGAIVQDDCFTGPVVTGLITSDLGTWVTDTLDPVGLYDDPDPGDPDFVGGRLSLNFQLRSSDARSLTNEARTVSASFDPDTTNNVATAPITVNAVADLSIDKTADVTEGAPGDLVTYELTVANFGPSIATNVVVADRLPEGTEYVSATTPQGTCVGGIAGDLLNPVVCNLGAIAAPPIPGPPAPVVITVVARIKSDTKAGTVLNNRAYVSSDTADRNNANDLSEAVVVVGSADQLFNPLTPSRQFDTRDGTGGVPVGKVPAGTALEFTVTGVNGVPAGAAAVSLNVTVDGPVASGWLSVYPCAAGLPLASNLNFEAGQTVANAVIAPVDPAGKVCFFTTTATDIVSDVSGWFRAASGLTTLTPVREFDTRDGTGGVPVGPRPAGSVLTFKVTGVNGVPAANVAAVALNVTVDGPVQDGHVTVFPCGPEPFTSNLNFVSGQTVPNLVVAPVSPQGTVCFATTGTTHLLADLSGWFATGSDYKGLNPSRLFDTRTGLGDVAQDKLQAGSDLVVQVAGRKGVPVAGAGSVILNLTATNPNAHGFVTAYPCGDRPLTSNVNFAAGQTVPNAVIAPLSADGTVCFYTNVSTDLLADVSGYFTGTGLPT